jgi:hypothetical protein
MYNSRALGFFSASAAVRPRPSHGTEASKQASMDPGRRAFPTGEVAGGGELSLVAAQAGEQQLVRPQQRRGGHGRQRRAEVGEVEVGGVGDAGGGGPERAGHLVGDERRAAERARALVVLHPAVEAGPVEDVAAVAEPPHLVAAADAAQAHRAVSGLRLQLQLVEPHHGEDLLDDHRRHRPELRAAVLLQQQQHRRLLRQVPPLRRGAVLLLVVVLQQRLVVVPEIQQVAEAHGVERPEEEAADVPQQQQEVEQLLREHQLRVAHRETHAWRDRGSACPDLRLVSLGVSVPLGLRWWEGGRWGRRDVPGASSGYADMARWLAMRGRERRSGRGGYIKREEEGWVMRGRISCIRTGGLAGGGGLVGFGGGGGVGPPPPPPPHCPVPCRASLV